MGSRRVGGGGWRVRWEDFSSVTTVNDIHQSHINIYFCFTFSSFGKGSFNGFMAFRVLQVKMFGSTF